MSVRFDRGGWGVRWRDGTGRLRAKRFRTEEAACAFDRALRDTAPAERDAKTVYGSNGGVYFHETAQGTRWRYVFRRTDGKQTSKRGFTSQSAARDALRRLTPPAGGGAQRVFELQVLQRAQPRRHAGQLERLGYLTRIPDPGDRRAKLIQLTEKGPG